MKRNNTPTKNRLSESLKQKLKETARQYYTNMTGTQLRLTELEDAPDRLVSGIITCTAHLDNGRNEGVVGISAGTRGEFKAANENWLVIARGLAEVGKGARRKVLDLPFEPLGWKSRMPLSAPVADGVCGSSRVIERPRQTGIDGPARPYVTMHEGTLAFARVTPIPTHYGKACVRPPPCTGAGQRGRGAPTPRGRAPSCDQRRASAVPVPQPVVAHMTQTTDKELTMT